MDAGIAEALGDSAASSTNPFGLPEPGVRKAAATEGDMLKNLEEVVKDRQRCEDEVARRAASKASKRMVMRDYSTNAGFNDIPGELRQQPHGVMIFVVTGPGHLRPASAHVGVLLLAYFGGEDEALVTREAIQYATKVILPRFNECDLRLMPLYKWTLLASTPERMADEAYSLRTMQTIMDTYYEQLKGRQESFVKKVERVVGKGKVSKQLERAGGEQEDTPETDREELLRRARNKRGTMQATRAPKPVQERAQGDDQLKLMGLDRDKGVSKSSKRRAMRKAQVQQRASEYDLTMPVPTNVMVQGQQVAAVCFLDDTRREARKGTVDREPMMRILGVYATEAEATTAVEQLGGAVADFDIDIVALGAWLFPFDVDYDKLENFKYRDDEQDKIMHRRIENRKEVAHHERERKQKGVATQELFLKAEQDVATDVDPDQYYKAHAIVGDVTSTTEAVDVTAEWEAKGYMCETTN